MRIPVHTKRPKFYIAVGLNEALSSWGSLDEARACLVRLKAHQPEDYERVRGVYETNKDTTSIRDRIFHAKGIKPIKRQPGSMLFDHTVYVMTVYDQGFHFYLISRRVWTGTQNTLKGIGSVIDDLFPAQEDDIADEPEVTEHARRFQHIHHLLAFVEEHHMKIVSSNTQVGP